MNHNFASDFSFRQMTKEIRATNKEEYVESTFQIEVGEVENGFIISEGASISHVSCYRKRWVVGNTADLGAKIAELANAHIEKRTPKVCDCKKAS